jgi:hypothetical protein
MNKLRNPFLNSRLFPLFALACDFVPALAVVLLGLLPRAQQYTLMHCHKFTQGCRSHRGEAFRETMILLNLIMSQGCFSPLSSKTK